MIHLRNELYAKERDGLVEVIRSSNNEVLLTLTLAAAEDLAFDIKLQAEHGRAQAEQS